MAVTPFTSIPSPLQCEVYPNPENVQQCRESFKLLYYAADSDIANERRPSWDAVTYRHLDAVAADSTFNDQG